MFEDLLNITKENIKQGLIVLINKNTNLIKFFLQKLQQSIDDLSIRLNNAVFSVNNTHPNNEGELTLDVGVRRIEKIEDNFRLTMSDMSTILLPSCRASRMPLTEYKVGDVAYSDVLPSWAFLECIKPGLTGPGLISGSFKPGNTIIDGQVSWKIHSILETFSQLAVFPIGCIHLSLNSDSPQLNFGGQWEFIAQSTLQLSVGDGTTEIPVYFWTRVG